MSGWLITGLIIILALWGVALYNSLVTLRQRNRQAFADIDVQLRQRHDLVPNLVETVKGYARHERETMDAVIQARNTAVSAKGAAQQAEAENVLSAALGRLFALAEAYPDLKANQNFLELQQQLDDIENKLAAARRFFNSAAAEYNARRESFPASFIANYFGFTPQDFFDLGEDKRTQLEIPPPVSFQP
jgi:LemA protein